MPYYVVISVVSFVIMFVIAYFQYNSAYTKIYEESAKRRINLAETLRKLPLAFFGKKNIADLSSTIMEDATQIEQLFSHTVPQIYAAVVSVFIMGVLMFIYNWQMSLAVFWVVPVAVLVFFLSVRYQRNSHTKLYNIKRDISDMIQEELDSAYEIKAYNREKTFSNTLNTSLDGYEKSLVKSELLIGALINFSYVILKLGLPSVILAGARSGVERVRQHLCLSGISRYHGADLQSNHGDLGQFCGAALPQCTDRPHERDGRHADAGRDNRVSSQKLRY